MAFGPGLEAWSAGRGIADPFAPLSGGLLPPVAGYFFDLDPTGLLSLLSGAVALVREGDTVYLDLTKANGVTDIEAVVEVWKESGGWEPRWHIPPGDPGRDYRFPMWPGDSPALMIRLVFRHVGH